LRGMEKGPNRNTLKHGVLLDNQALLTVAMNRHAAAESLYRQALDIKKRTGGDNHPHYAGSLNNLGELIQAVGRFPDAEPPLRQALEINRVTLGERHPEYLITLHNLARLYWQMGDLARAETLMRQAVDTTRGNVELAAGGQSERQQF